MLSRWIVAALAGALVLSLHGCAAPTEIEMQETPAVATATQTRLVATQVVAAVATGTPSGTPPPPTATPSPSQTPATATASLPPATAAPAATIAPLGDAPLTWEALGPWLADAWQDRRDPAEVRAALMAAGWQDDQAQWRNLELTGDLRDEWVLQLVDITADPEYADMWFFAAPGNLWIISEGGPLYSHHDGTDLLSREPGLMPEVAGLADMTGDGLPELVLKDTDCGAHTCYGYFTVIGLTRAGFRNLVDSRDPQFDAISLSYPEVRLVPEGDRSVLMLHGGITGSAGAGIMRAYTEVWAWEGEDDLEGAVRWRETVWDPTEYRHHLLYEAMDLMDAGELADAEALLIRVLEDPDLIVEPFDATAEETQTAIAQFAGFRLVLVHLLRGDRMAAGNRAAWLNNAYPGAPLSISARHAVDGWQGQTGLHLLCERLRAELEQYPEPTGPLAYMGYGNPSITTAQLCTW